MELSKHIIEEAEELLQGGASPTLPIQLSSAPVFYMATGDDEIVMAFVAFIHAGAVYKIGPKKIN